MSSSERDNNRRNTQHQNVIAAAKQQGVGRVWYVSLAFGGYGDTSKIGFQQAHYETENQLLESGVNFFSLRAGVYSDAFPLFLNWYPSTQTVLFPRIEPSVDQGKIVFTAREELGEGIATLLAKGSDAFPGIQPMTEKNILLLTGPKGESLVELVGAINRGRGTEVGGEVLPSDEWIEECARDDEGAKGRPWFEARLVFTQGVCEGDTAVVDPALATLLGRAPETGTQTVERLVRNDPGYTRHQNHVNRK